MLFFQSLMGARYQVTDSRKEQMHKGYDISINLP